MLFTISFFKSRNLEKIDYAELILYFEKELKCKITYGEEEVRMNYTDEVFDITYSFLITKRSRVNNLALLNPEYVNIRFLIELPLIIPEQVSREIFKVIENICLKFNFGVYYEGLDDIEHIDISKLMAQFLILRSKELINYNEPIYYLENIVITHIANFHQMFSYLKENYEDVTINKYKMLTFTGSNEISLGIIWQLDTPTIIPPHLDYIIIFDDGVHQFIPYNIFIKKTKRFFVELKTLIPDATLLYLNYKNCKKVSKICRKMSKYYVHDKTFNNCEITNIIEK